MLKKCIGNALFLFLVFTNSIGFAINDEQISKKSLERIGNDYLAFLHFAGNAATDCASIDAESTVLFASNFRKIVNNQTALEGRANLGPYLWGFRENLGRWKICPNTHTLVSSNDESSHIAVTYVVESIDATEPVCLIVIALLKVDANGKITEVFEVDHSIVTPFLNCKVL